MYLPMVDTLDSGGKGSALTCEVSILDLLMNCSTEMELISMSSAMNLSNLFSSTGVIL